MPTPMLPAIRPDPILDRAVRPLICTLRLRPLLVVIARRSGRIHAVPVDDPYPFEGERYLVSPRGTLDWVVDLRLEGGGVLEIDGRHVAFRTEELIGIEAARVVHAWSLRTRRLRRLRHSPIADVDDLPVFRILPTMVLEE